MLIPYEQLRSKGIPLSKCQLWRLERAGKFPKRVAISSARHAWVESEIDAWIASRPRRQFAASTREQVAA